MGTNVATYIKKNSKNKIFWGGIILVLVCLVLPPILVSAIDLESAKAELARKEAEAAARSQMASPSISSPAVPDSASLIPLLVVEDLIKAGKFDEAQQALDAWKSKGLEATRVTELNTQLDKARQAGTLMDQAEARAASEVTKRNESKSTQQNSVGSSVALGIKALAEGNYATSEKYFKDALAVDPGNFEAQQGLANVQEARANQKTNQQEGLDDLLLPEEPASAKSVEDAALADAAQLFSRGFQAEQKGDYESAANLYQEVLNLFPSSADAQKRLMMVQAKQLEIKEKAKAAPDTMASQIVKIAPDFDRGVHEFNDGNYEEAKKSFEKVLSVIPDHPAAQQYLARCNELGGVSAVVEAPQKPSAPVVVPISEPTTYQKARDMFADGKLEDAKLLFAQVKPSDQDDYLRAQEYISRIDSILAKNTPASITDVPTVSKQTRKIDAPANKPVKQESIEPSMVAVSSIPPKEDPWKTDSQPSSNWPSVAIENEPMVVPPMVESTPPQSVQVSDDTAVIPKVEANNPLPTPVVTQAESNGKEMVVKIEDQPPQSVTSLKSSQPINISQKPLESIPVEEKPAQVRSIAPSIEPKRAESKPIMVAANDVSAPQTTPAEKPANTSESFQGNVPLNTSNGDPKVKELIETGTRQAAKGDILTACELWEEALKLDPQNEVARAFLDKYAADRAQAQRKKEDESRRTDVDARVEKVLNEKTFVLEQDSSVNINSILSTMGAIADIQIITGQGVEGDIHALRTTTLTYREFLDRVLSLNGYSWRREPGTNIIEVTRDLVTKRFPLSEEQYQALKRLAMGALGGKETDDFSEALREVILGKVTDKTLDATIPGRTFILNKYLLELVVRDSRHNVDLVEQFLNLYESGEIKSDKDPMIVETFRLPKTGGSDLARIINLRLFGKAEFDANFKDDDPYLIFNEETGILIIRHTPEKLELVKRLMADPKFLSQVVGRELKARKFTVVPAEDLRNDTPDSILRRKKQVQFTKQVFQSLLYGSQSIEEAAAEGRVMYPDPDEGTIDVVDTPDNLAKLEEYLQGIGESSNMTRTVLIRRRDVNDLAISLSGLVLSVQTSQTGGGIGTGTNQNLTQQQNLGGQFGGQLGGMSGGFGGMGMVGGFGGGMGGMAGGLGGGYFGLIPVIVKADVATKKMIITGFRLSDIDMAVDLIERLDVAVDQVEVETRLVELQYDTSDELGITMTVNNILDIDDGDETGPGFTLSGADLDLISRPNNPAGSTLQLVTLGKTTIDAVIRMLSRMADLRILTAPKVTIVSGRQGEVFLGESITYVDDYELVVNENSPPVVSPNLESEEMGFTLTVTPSVTGDGHIEMDLEPTLEIPGERTPVPNPLTGSLDPVGRPNIVERRATVRVRVNDGETLVIGGLLRRTINHVEGRTPLFGYIPGLGWLFTEKSDKELTQNLLILVTARILKEE